MRNKRRKILLVLAITFLTTSALGAAFLFMQDSDVDVHAIAAETGKPEITKPTDKARTSAVSEEKVKTEAITSHQRTSTSSVLGDFTTKFGAAQKTRNHNIAKAVDSINGTVVKPGETFSFNDTIGPTSQQRGYQKARVFAGGKKSYGFGGGVCQVSSTLFNAVEEADLKVTERHNHSLPVTYVPKGKDAATSYGSVDFKFVNNKSHPIQIKSSVESNTIHIQILAA